MASFSGLVSKVEGRHGGKLNLAQGVRTLRASRGTWCRGPPHKGEDDASLDHLVAEDGRAEGVNEVFELRGRAGTCKGDHKVEVFERNVGH